MCNMSNEVPQLFDWDQLTNQPSDRWQRAELNHSAVEYIAPTEYMVRAPQPAIYVFLIDVSHASMSTGMSSFYYSSQVLKCPVRYGGDCMPYYT
jgi:protein transport protein SEC24